jgi:hypothetical protein
MELNKEIFNSTIVEKKCNMNNKLSGGGIYNKEERKDGKWVDLD